MLKRFSKDPVYRQATEKADGSPVTKADLEVSQFLVSRLEGWGVPVVSEEGDLYEGCETPYFLVDPLDGTKHFSSGQPDYAVLVGYVENQKSTFGSLCSPEENKVFWAQKGQGAFLNGVPLKRSAPTANIVAYSSGFHKRVSKKWILEALSVGKVLTRGSALKFCDVAEGIADVFPRFGPTGEWDTAAAQILLEETGCILMDIKTRRPLVYGKPKRLNSGFIACHKSLEDKAIRVLDSLLERRKKDDE